MKSIKAVLEFINKYFKSLLFLLILFLVFYPSKKVELQKPNLMDIQLTGPIFSDKEFLKKIDIAMKDNIKGVLLVINSPGGAVAPSVEMSLAIKRLKKSKPVVAYAKGLMTSGSYYAGIWADKIIANPGATIGSIGVIFQSPNIEQLASKLGVSEQVVKAGKYKEIGTFARSWKPYERAELQKIIDDTYKMFISDVAKARKLDINKSSEFADAHVFSASEAKKVGLVDEIGSIYEAKNELIKLSGVKQAIWKKEDKFEKFLDKITSKLNFYLFSYLWGVKATL